MKKYTDKKGRLIFASAGLGGEQFMTMYRNPGKWNLPTAHKLKSKELPPRDTEVEAQTDLNQYAKKKGWEEVNI